MRFGILLLVSFSMSVGFVFANTNDCYTSYWADEWQKAFVQCSTAAVNGDSEAQKNLGWLYQNGKGVNQDHAEAARWYAAAANQGNAAAQSNLGIMYYYGTGVALNYSEAARLFTAASDQGNVTAQRSLGIMYSKGEGVYQSFTLATYLFQKASENGDSTAQRLLGIHYALGYGVVSNYVISRMWLEVALNNGNDSLNESIIFVEKNMSDDEIDFSRSLALNCIDMNFYNCHLSLSEGNSENIVGEQLDVDAHSKQNEVTEATLTVTQQALIDDSPSHPSCWSAATMENNGDSTVSVRIEGTAYDKSGYFIKDPAYNFNNVRPGTVSSQQYPLSVFCRDVGEIRYRVTGCFINGETTSQIDYCEARIDFINLVPTLKSSIDGLRE